MAVGDNDEFAHVFRSERHDSICRNCFKTVGSALSESDLAPYEQNHVCDWDYLGAPAKEDFDRHLLHKQDQRWSARLQ